MLGSVVRVFLAYLAFSAGPAGAAGPQLAENDPIKVLLDAYMEELNHQRTANPPRERVLENYREWRARLLDVAAANTKSPLYESAIVQALALSNGLGDYQKSAELANILIDRSREKPMEQFRLYSELGEIYSYSSNKSQDVGERAKSVRSMERANEIFAQIRDLDVPETAKGKYLRNLATLAQYQEKDAAGYARAAKYYNRGRAYLEGIKDRAAIPEVASGHDLEFFASSEMEAYIRARDLAGAEAALMTLNNPSQRWPWSFYANRFAEVAYGSEGPEYRKFLARWLADKPADSWTPFLKFYLARGQFKANLFAEALVVYDDLHKNSSKVFLDQDKDVIRTGSGGYYAEILNNLATCLLKVGERDRSKALLKEFNEIYRNDLRQPEAQSRLTALDKPAGPSEEGAKEGSAIGASGRWSRTTLFIVAINIVVLAMIFVWLRKKKGQKDDPLG